MKHQSINLFKNQGKQFAFAKLLINFIYGIQIEINR